MGNLEICCTYQQRVLALQHATITFHRGMCMVVLQVLLPDCAAAKTFVSTTDSTTDCSDALRQISAVHC